MIAEITTITNQFDFTGNYIDTDGVTHTMTIFDTTYFLTEIRHNYFNREIFIDTEAPATDIVNIFYNWKLSRAALYAKQAYAYTLAYNPIENYLSNEVIETEHGLTVTHTHTDDNVTRTYNADKISHDYRIDKVQRDYTADTETTTYTNLTDSTDHKKYGVNSATAVNQSQDVNTRNGEAKNVHSGSYSDTHTGGYDDTHSGGYTDAHTGSNADANSGTDTVTATKSGNIGVMTAAQMLQAEFDGLKQDLADRALREFLQRYTFYSGEVNDIW